MDETETPRHTRNISWRHDEKLDDAPRRRSRPRAASKAPSSRTIEEVLAQEDLYAILGVPHNDNLDKMELRRAYLARSKACHPE